MGNAEGGIRNAVGGMRPPARRGHRGLHPGGNVEGRKGDSLKKADASWKKTEDRNEFEFREAEKGMAVRRQMIEGFVKNNKFKRRTADSR